VFPEDTLDRSLLAVWGASSTDLYAVGGPLRNEGFEALALHFDGDAWRELPVGGSDSYWWVHGSSATDVFFVGEAGRVTRWDGTKASELDSGTTATLWGAIAFASDDVWVVGGMVGGAATTPDDVVLHYDGSSFEAVALPGEPLGRALFKVWGTSSDDLFVVGEGGVIWHKQGDTWTNESGDPQLAEGNLTTVHGCTANDVYAVGGRDILHYDGAAWSRLDKQLGSDVNGVVCVDASTAAIVGMGGLKQRLVDGEWIDEFSVAPFDDLHAVWADETGAYWAVGGDFVLSPKPNVARHGVVARYGPGKVPSALTE
ncbi:MAG: hypothetical protein JNK04_00715, partial [Myxococcales bacterium]|nr:hypothetical protein [Myxococcales bacterium]